MCEIIGKLITPQEGEVCPLFLQLVVAFFEAKFNSEANALLILSILVAFS